MPCVLGGFHIWGGGRGEGWHLVRCNKVFVEFSLHFLSEKALFGQMGGAVAVAAAECVARRRVTAFVTKNGFAPHTYDRPGRAWDDRDEDCCSLYRIILLLYYKLLYYIIYTAGDRMCFKHLAAKERIP